MIENTRLNRRKNIKFAIGRASIVSIVEYSLIMN